MQSTFSFSFPIYELFSLNLFEHNEGNFQATKGNAWGDSDMLSPGMFYLFSDLSGLSWSCLFGTGISGRMGM
jgi:hypothetical protein